MAQQHSACVRHTGALRTSGFGRFDGALPTMDSGILHSSSTPHLNSGNKPEPRRQPPTQRLQIAADPATAGTATHNT
jgi:hypothetical protein